MAFVYVLKGTSGRYYIGCTTDVESRLQRHNSGMVHSTKRLGLPLEVVAYRAFLDMKEARTIETKLKKWKSPSKAIEYLKRG